MSTIDKYPEIKWYYKHNPLHQMFLYTKHIRKVDERNLHFSLSIKQIKILYQMQNN